MVNNIELVNSQIFLQFFFEVSTTSKHYCTHSALVPTHTHHVCISHNIILYGLREISWRVMLSHVILSLWTFIKREGKINHLLLKRSVLTCMEITRQFNIIVVQNWMTTTIILQWFHSKRWTFIILSIIIFNSIITMINRSIQYWKTIIFLVKLS